MIDFKYPENRQSKSSAPRILLTSVFGPYCLDDERGSRRMNPMELYHNQVTREQGAFSLRMFHRSWGLMLIQANIDAPCTVLDFPTYDRFVEELKTQSYDVIGISSIIPNTQKAIEMCRLIREYQPNAKIVIGGHIANVPNLDQKMDADYIVRGEGVRWFREFLGEDVNRPINHPIITSGLGTRTVGVPLSEETKDIAATIIPSVGCPLGCNFCSTSAMFGGKGKFINFFESGDQLFDIMCKVEEETGAWSFFIMDENFLLHRRRALRLLELMEEHGKAWSLDVFSSANALRQYSMDQLVRLGVNWVWMGLEGEDSQYNKLDDADTFALVRELQSHGIHVLGSTIIGLEEHDESNIDQAIDYAVRHDTDFHQFMLYTPVPGTPLHAELSAQGRMKDESEFHVSDIHGQLMFNYRHPNIEPGREGEMLAEAFRRDFEVNGPSIVRVVRTTLAGWKRYKNHPDERVRRRFQHETQTMATSLSALVGATVRYYRGKPVMQEKMKSLLRELHREFGLKSRFFSYVGGIYLMFKIRAEERRLATEWGYEPPTFYEANKGARKIRPEMTACRYIKPTVPASSSLPANSGSRLPLTDEPTVTPPLRMPVQVEMTSEEQSLTR